MRSSGVFVVPGFFALLLACFLDASTALGLSLTADSSGRNFYLARCENDIGNPIQGATLTLNATTPPTDCFSMTTISPGEIMFNFTISCEGFLQCKSSDDCSESQKLEAYPALPDPPSDSRRTVYVLAGRDELLVLESNVQSSITGQVEVMWEFTGAGQPTSYTPTGDKHSLVLNNLTAANAGEYYPVATATSSSLTDSKYKMVSGQHYLIKVEFFDPPHFTSNLSCQETQQQIWSCSTQAAGTDLDYDWFINDELVNSNDSRVMSIFKSEIFLGNLQSSDMQLMLQVHSTKRQRSYRITQSAAILLPSTPCPTTQPVQTDETCLLPWVPIVGTMAIVIALLLISHLGFFFCLCHRRRQLQSGGEITFTLPKGELQDYGCVLDWLSYVLSSLRRNVVEGNKELRKALEELRKECRNLSVGFDDDESSDIENRPQIANLKAALDQLLGK